MTQGPARRRPRAPIALQIAVLLVISLLAAQAMSLLAILATPPPRPAIHRMAELAEALKGGSLQTAEGRTLERSISDTPPKTSATNRWAGRPRFRAARALAAAIGVPEDDVRLIQRGQPLILEITSGRVPPGFNSGFFPRFPDDRRGAVADNSLGPDPDRPPTPVPPPPGAAGFVFQDRFGTPDSNSTEPENGFIGRDRFRGGNEIFGEFTAALKRSDGRWTVVESVEPFPNEWQTRISVWVLGCLIVVTIASYLFARRISAPIDRFAEAAEQLGRDPRAPPMNLSGPAEIGRAAHAFNDMQARIKRYVDDRTAMVGAISHDLRTPLARMRFKLETAKPDTGSILGDIGQMEQMIAAVLAFIRDASEPGQRQRIDLLSLLECVVDDAALVGGEAEIETAIKLEVEGDALALQRLFANLVDNALKYGRRAHVRLFAEGGDAVVEVRDEGPGLPERELERVFTPFYRTDAARNLDDGGVGLGLAVARSTARAHGGDIVLRSDSTGLTAVTHLPLAKPA
ncbi:MAG: ATP-binding protein [Caulobacteraceae bacterium]